MGDILISIFIQFKKRIIKKEFLIDLLMNNMISCIFPLLVLVVCVRFQTLIYMFVQKTQSDR